MHKTQEASLFKQEFARHSFPGDDIEYITPSWIDLQRLTFEIARQIHASGQQFDRIITLAKGGWPMTRCLVDFLGIQNVASIGVRFYAGIDERLERPLIYQDLPVSVVGERILLFDDVADTGISLQFTCDYLANYRGIQQLATATLIAKPQSIITPDYSGADTTAWIIFPYDAAEMISILGNKWRQQEVGADEISTRFRQLGFHSDWIDYFKQA